VSELEEFDFTTVVFPHSAEHYRDTGEVLYDRAIVTLRSCARCCSALLFHDHGAMRFVTRPKDDDVVVSTLLLGRITTDLVAATSVASARSVPLDSTSRRASGCSSRPTARRPRYRGQNRVSPMAALDALAMLLEHLGEWGAASRVRNAIDQVPRQLRNRSRRHDALPRRDPRGDRRRHRRARSLTAVRDRSRLSR
jgi:hypothetical protein